MQLNGGGFILCYYVIPTGYHLESLTLVYQTNILNIEHPIHHLLPHCPSPSSNYLPTLILSAPLTPVDSLLRHRVSHSLAKPALTQLAADGAVDAVLELVHGLDASDFGLLELFWRGVSRVRLGVEGMGGGSSGA